MTVRFQGYSNNIHENRQFDVSARRVETNILSQHLASIILYQVLIIENPDALLSPAERATAPPDIVPNPLAWLPPELPSHVKASERTVPSSRVVSYQSVRIYKHCLCTKY